LATEAASVWKKKNITFTREALRRYARADSLYIEHYHYRI